MGIHDRDYYREDRGRRGGGSGGRAPGVARLRMLSVTAWLIIINVAVFATQMGLTNAGDPVLTGSKIDPTLTPVQVDSVVPGSVWRRTNSGVVPAVDADQHRAGTQLIERLVLVRPNGSVGPDVGEQIYLVMDPIARFGHFSTFAGFQRLEVWRLVTFQFLHSGFLHIFFNMFALWIFAPLVEQQLGRKRFLAFYLVCGIFGGLLYLLLNLLHELGVAIPGVLEVGTRTPLVGASAGVFGVLMACAYIAPKATVRLIFPPIPMPMKWFVYGYFVVALYNLIKAGHNQGGDAAHVGGALAGYFFIRRPHLLRDFFDVFGDSRKKPVEPPPSPHRDGEIDAILDKINREGLAALDDGEKKTLAEHSRRERGQ